MWEISAKSKKTPVFCNLYAYCSHCMEKKQRSESNVQFVWHLLFQELIYSVCLVINHTPKSMDYRGTGWKFCLVIK